MLETLELLRYVSQFYLLYISGSNVDEKMNQTKRVAPSPGLLIECVCLHVCGKHLNC